VRPIGITRTVLCGLQAFATLHLKGLREGARGRG
jgi:hypothetical protein